MNEEGKKRLNQLGQSILKEKGFDLKKYQDYDWIKNESIKNETIEGYAIEGYAEYYLLKCWNESEMNNEADATIYRQLVDIDSKLGSNASLQLWGCLSHTTRWDLIKV